MSLLRSLSSLFTRSDRVTLFVLVLLMVLNGLLEVFGIGMLFPYVAILQDPAQDCSKHLPKCDLPGFGLRVRPVILDCDEWGIVGRIPREGIFFALDDQLSASFHLCQTITTRPKSSDSISQPALCVLPVREHVHPYWKFDHVVVTGLQRSYTIGAVLDRGGSLYSSVW